MFFSRPESPDSATGKRCIGSDNHQETGGKHPGRSPRMKKVKPVDTFFQVGNAADDSDKEDDCGHVQIVKMDRHHVGNI